MDERLFNTWIDNHKMINVSTCVVYYHDNEIKFLIK